MNITQEMLDAGIAAMIEFRKSGGDWTDKPAHAVEAVLQAALSVESAPLDQRFTQMLVSIINDTQDALGFTDEEKECSNGSLEILTAIRDLKEQAKAMHPNPNPDAAALSKSTAKRVTALKARDAAARASTVVGYRALGNECSEGTQPIRFTHNPDTAEQWRKQGWKIDALSITTPSDAGGDTPPNPGDARLRELVSKICGGAVAAGSDREWVSIRRYLLDELLSLLDGKGVG